MTSFYVQSNFSSNTSKVAQMTIILVLHILPVGNNADFWHIPGWLTCLWHYY